MLTKILVNSHWLWGTPCPSITSDPSLYLSYSDTNSATVLPKLGHTQSVPVLVDPSPPALTGDFNCLPIPLSGPSPEVQLSYVANLLNHPHSISLLIPDGGRTDPKDRNLALAVVA